MKKEDKSIIIEKIAASLQEYENFYLADIATLNAAKTSILRRECSKQDIKLLVVKNTLLRKALDVIPAERLWVNPDCGLKTRAWPETYAALEVMVNVTKKLRAELN